jgi:outer membrane protein W
MKRFLFYIILALLTIPSFAQEVRTLKCLFGMGYSPSWPIYGHPDGNAILLNFEPSYFIKDNLSVSVRFEIGFPGQTISSLGANGQYYLSNFSTKYFRPFVGWGFGIYHPSLNSKSKYPPFTSQDAETKIGFYPRIGFDYRHLSVVLDYNLVPSSQAKVNYLYPEIETGDLENSYLALKVGMFFGGKKVGFKDETKFTRTYSKFRVGIGFGFSPTWSYGESSSSSNQILAYLEPSYQVKNNISVGVRLETKLIQSSYSYSVNSQYYFSNKQFRPFAGLGFGFYKGNFSTSFPWLSNDPKSETNFGFYPRVGFDYGHFSFIMDYNLVPPSTVTTYDANQQSSFVTTNQNSYLGVKFGVFFGGGRKRVKNTDQQ